jgi:hypothetical protein
MKVTIEDIQKAINKMAEFQFNLNKIKKIADDEKMSVEELFIGDVPYNEFVKEGFIYCDELDTLLEAAKESIIDNLDKNKISLLKKFERFDGDLAQEYYISEKYANFILKKEYQHLLKRNIKKLFYVFWMEDLILVVLCADLLQKFS